MEKKKSVGMKKHAVFAPNTRLYRYIIASCETNTSEEIEKEIDKDVLKKGIICQINGWSLFCRDMHHTFKVKVL